MEWVKRRNLSKHGCTVALDKCSYDEISWKILDMHEHLNMAIKLRLFLKFIILYWEKFLDIMDKFFRLDPKQVGEVYAKVGRECMVKGLEKDAIDLYQKVLVLNPKDRDAYFQLGKIYTRTKNWEEAMRCYQRTIDLGLRNHEVYYRMALVHDHFDQTDEALKCYKEAIKLDSNHDEYYFRLGLVYDSKKMHDKAINSYEKAISINSQEPKYYYSLGLAYDGKGRHEKAVDFLRKAMELQEKEVPIPIDNE